MHMLIKKRIHSYFISNRYYCTEITLPLIDKKNH